MTLRDLIIKESCCGKKQCAKDFDDEEKMSKDDVTTGEEFQFVAKITVNGENEADAKAKLKDALADFSGVKIKAAKSKKEEKTTDETNDDIADDEENEEEPEAAKKHVCPECGKDFTHCTCR